MALSAKSVCLIILSAGRAFAAATFEDGMKFMKAERYHEAIGALEQAARREPGSIEILMNLGWAYWRVKRVEDAWRCFDMLVKLDPENPQYLRLLAEIEVARGNNERALAVSKKALKFTPNDRDTSVVLSRAFVNLRRFDDAGRILDAMIRRYPSHPGVQAAMGEYLTQTDRDQEALVYFDKLVAAEPKNIAYRRSRARVLYKLGDFDGATSEWKKIVEQKPDEDTLMNLGWAYWQSRDFEEAHKIASRLLKLDVGNPAFLRFMANIEMERGNFQEALQWSQRATALIPDDRDSLLASAKAMFNLGRDEEAVKIVDGLMKTHPTHPGVQYHYADFALQHGRASEALPLAEALLGADEANPAYRKLRARALHELGRFDEAASDWRRLAEQKPPEPEALEMLYNDAMANNDWRAAADWLKILAAVRPPDALHYQRLAAAYIAGERLEEALEAAEKAVKADPAQMALRYMKGDVLERMFDFKEARKTYEEILGINPSSRRAIYALIRVAELEGDYPRALELLRVVKAAEGKRPSPYTSIDEARLLAEAGRLEPALAAVGKLIQNRITAIPIIAYSGLSRFGRGEFVPLETFRSQVQALSRAGYKTIDFADLERFVRRTGPLPDKPIMITFDDPRVDLFKQADPILSAAGFKAVVFAHIGGLKRYPAQPSVEALRYWQETGRWEIQSHGVAAHDLIQIDEKGTLGHFLSNRAWIKSEGRRETSEEFRERLEREYRGAKSRLIEAFPKTRVTAFAFPFGDNGYNDYTNTSDAGGANERLVRRFFSFALVGDQYGYNTASTKPAEFRRLEVKRTVSTAGLERMLAMNEPWVRAKMVQAGLWNRAAQPGRALVVYDQLERSGLRQPELYAQRGGAMRQAGNDYEAQRLFERAYQAEPDYERYQNLMEQARLLGGPRLDSRVEGASDSLSNESARALARLGFSVGRFELRGWGGRGFYGDRRMDPQGAPVERRIESREGGLDLRAFISPRTQAYGSFARRDFQGFEQRAADFTAGFTTYLLPELRATLEGGEANVETTEAIRLGRRARHYGGGMEWDVALNWRATANLDYYLYNDSNFQNDVRLGLNRRISDRFSAGYAFRQGDSARLTNEYWTPRRLKQHMAILSYAQPFGRMSRKTGLRPGELQLEGGTGYGLQERASSTVQTGRAGLVLRIMDHLLLTIDGIYTRRPTYIRRQVSGGLSLSY